MSIAKTVEKGETARQLGEAIIAAGRSKLVPLGRAFIAQGRAFIDCDADRVERATLDLYETVGRLYGMAQNDLAMLIEHLPAPERAAFEEVLRAKQRAIEARAASFKKPQKLTREQRYSSYFNNAGTIGRALRRCEGPRGRHADE